MFVIMELSLEMLKASADNIIQYLHIEDEDTKQRVLEAVALDYKRVFETDFPLPHQTFTIELFDVVSPTHPDIYTIKVNVTGQQLIDGGYYTDDNGLDNIKKFIKEVMGIEIKDYDFWEFSDDSEGATDLTTLS